MEKKEAYRFTSEDAENYDFYLGPVLFAPYGRYLASQIDTSNLSKVLELACGTGRVTEYIRKALPGNAELWATDLSNDMLDIAKRRLAGEHINFKTEDIQNLSFADNTFDLVICQFGLMYLPDKQKGLDEMFRVLKPGGKLMCFTWDATLNNPAFKLLIDDLMMPYFEDEDPARFFTPFSLHNPQQLAGWLQNAGFKSIKTETVALNSGAASLDHLVTGSYLKHPLGYAVREKEPAAFEIVGRKFKGELERRYSADVSFPMSALLSVAMK